MAVMKATFGRFTLDSGRRQLFDGDQPVKLTSKAFDLLRLLIEHHPDVVPTATIMAVIWRNANVTDGVVTTAVGDIRKALGESKAQPQFIRTVTAHGYAFDGKVERTGAAAPPADRYWLISQDRTVPLEEGETIIGREAGLGMVLPHPSVSRRHARLVIHGTDATIEDLNSRNGTFVGGIRIRGRTPLHPGDSVQIADIMLTFVTSAAGSAAPTKPLRL
jgi:DNA-binding winged helix-turn-helix (wHTH) protein